MFQTSKGLVWLIQASNLHLLEMHMPNFNKMFPSKWMRAVDIDEPLVVTIKRVT